MKLAPVRVFTCKHPLIQHRFNQFQHGFMGVANGFDFALQQNRVDVEANVEAVCSALQIQQFWMTLAVLNYLKD